MKSIFYFTAKNGKMVFPDRGAGMLRSYLIASEGKEMEAILGVRKKIRSNQQNRFWHGVVCKLLSDYTGHTPEDIHYFLRQKFLSEPEDALKIPKSTTSLSTIEFKELIENVQIWASSDLGVVIPDPEPSGEVGVI